MRLIDADEVVNRIVFHTNLPTEIKEAIEDEIEDVPTAEPKIGRWENVAMFTVECSECKAQLHELEYTNFCPNCGTKMVRRGC